MAKDEKVRYQGAQFDMRRPEQKLGDLLSLPEVGCSILVAFLLGMIIFSHMNYYNNFIFIISALTCFLLGSCIVRRFWVISPHALDTRGSSLFMCIHDYLDINSLNYLIW